MANVVIQTKTLSDAVGELQDFVSHYHGEIEDTISELEKVEEMLTEIEKNEEIEEVEDVKSELSNIIFGLKEINKEIE